MAYPSKLKTPHAPVLGEGGQITEKLAFDYILYQHIMKISESMHDAHLFVFSVRMFEATLTPYFDRLYIDRKREVEDESQRLLGIYGIEKDGTKNDNVEVDIKREEYMRKYEQLMQLINRRGILPLESITEEDFEDIKARSEEEKEEGEKK